MWSMHCLNMVHALLIHFGKQFNVVNTLCPEFLTFEIY